MNKNSSFPWWGIALGVGCICIVCAGLRWSVDLSSFKIVRAALAEVVSTVLPPPTSPVSPELHPHHPL